MLQQVIYNAQASDKPYSHKGHFARTSDRQHSNKRHTTLKQVIDIVKNKRHIAMKEVTDSAKLLSNDYI